MILKRILLTAAATSALALAACETTAVASTTSSPAASASAATSSVDAQRLAQLQRELEAERRRAAELEASLASQQTITVQSASFDNVAAEAGYPLDAQPGECFARVLVPQITEVQVEQVIDTPERTELKVIPATYDFVTEQVLVKEESIAYDIIPAEYETITEQVLVKEEQREVIVIPAVYEDYQEQVLVRPAYTTWKPGAGLFGRTAPASGFGQEGIALPTGEILCKVEVPAEYRTVSRKRLVTAERTEERVIPAEYSTVTRQVVKRPAQTIERIIPAQYDTVQVRRMVTAPREERIVVPASFRSVETETVVGGGNLEWREVLCDTNATPAKIAEVQRALAAAGFNPGASDGVFGPGTLRAMEDFQRSRGLIVGQLTRETVQALGVDFEPVIIR